MTTIILIYGLIIGSFLNVYIYRIPEEESISFPPSHCGSCGGRIGWYDNIPILSYIILGGRCRSCKARISIQYPFVEMLNAILYIVMFQSFGFTMDFFFFSIISSILIVVLFIDLKHMLIPDSLILTVLAVEVIHKIVLYYFNGSMNLKTSFLGGLLAGGLFLLIVLISGGGMGEGDITLIASVGFILGTKLVFLNILLSFIIGAIVSLFLLGFKIKTRKDPIPFGPFIIVSFWIVLLFGEEIIDLYIKLVL